MEISFALAYVPTTREADEFALIVGFVFSSSRGNLSGFRQIRRVGAEILSRNAPIFGVLFEPFFRVGKSRIYEKMAPL
jgi:hypothetical protein